MKKSKLTIVSALASATCTLLGSTNVKAEGAGWKIDTAYLSYSEKDRVTAHEPAIKIQKTFDNDSKLNLNFVYDTLSGPSPSGAAPSNQIQTFSGPSGGGSNIVIPAGQIPMDKNFEDQRTQFGASWDAPINRLLRYNIGFNISSEHDYKSLGISTGISRDFNRKNTTFSTGLSYSHDTIDPVGGTPTAGSTLLDDHTYNTFTAASGTIHYNNERENNRESRQIPDASNEDTEGGTTSSTLNSNSDSQTKEVADWFAGVSQVINAQTIMQFSLGLNYAKGYLNDPYKLVSIVDAETGVPLNVVLGGIIHEKRPDTRLKTSLYWETRHHFNWGDTLDTSYRYMFDDWGIRSHTVDVKYRWNMGDHFYLQPHLRWYRQTAADFYHESLSNAEPIPNEFSADTRLAAFDARTIGFKFGYAFFDYNDISLRIEKYQQIPHTIDNAIGIQATQDTFPDLQATIVQVSYSFTF